MPRLVLIGGGDIVAGDLREIDTTIIHKYGKRILILPWTTPDITIQKKYDYFMQDYFSSLGAIVSFAYNSHEAKDKIPNVDCIYIPGGNTEYLLAKLFEAQLQLHTFKGTIIGNSAGAIALCANAIITKDKDTPETIIVRGEGLFDQSVEPHYDGKNDMELRRLGIRYNIYAIPECCALVVEENPNDGSSPEMYAIGKVFQFKHGRKSLFRE